MHILFVCAEFPFSQQPTGGFGSYVNSISRGLKQAGHKVSVICYGNVNRYFMDKYKRNIYVLTKLKKSKYNSSIVTRLYHFLDYPLRFSWLVVKLIKKIATTDKIDIIEGGDFGAELFFYLLLRKNRQAKTVIKLHTPSFVIRETNREKLNCYFLLMEKLENFCLRKCDGIYSPTKALAGIVRQRLAIFIKTIVPYPIPEINAISCIKDKNLVLYAGKLQEKKGIFVLVHAIKIILKRLPDVKFIFVGPDTLKDGRSSAKRLHKIIKQQNIASSVKIISDISQNKLFKLFAKTIITVIPSLWENFPNIILEAGLHRSVVIASNTGGIPEIIRNNYTGVLVPPGNIKVLADKIIYAIKNSKFREKLIVNNYNNLINNYQLEKITEKTIFFYGTILKQRTGELMEK